MSRLSLSMSKVKRIYINVMKSISYIITLLWRHNGRDGVSNHPPDDCLLNRPCRHRSKKTYKLRVAGLCAGNSPVTGEFPAQMASNSENVPIWWRHHEIYLEPWKGGFRYAAIIHLPIDIEGVIRREWGSSECGDTLCRAIFNLISICHKR